MCLYLQSWYPTGTPPLSSHLGLFVEQTLVPVTLQPVQY